MTLPSLLVSVLVLSGAVWPRPQAVVTATGSIVQAPATEPARTQEAEQAIRQAAHDVNLATLTADPAMLERNTTRRTSELYDLVFELASENPKVRDQFRRSGIKNGRDFLRLGLDQAARSIGVAPAAAESFAKETAASPLSFLSPTEARLEVKTGAWRVVLEDGRWKVDQVDALKASYLKSPLLGPEARARLEKFD